ncbi:unnamed protein product, partial [marine sediment metagenome]
LLAVFLVMYLLALAIIGWSNGPLRIWTRIVFGIVGFIIMATLNYIIVIFGILLILALKFYGKKLFVRE